MIKNGPNLSPPPIGIFGIFASHAITIASRMSAYSQVNLLGTTLYGSLRGVACQMAVVAPYIPAIMYQEALISDWNILAGNIQYDSTIINLIWQHRPRFRLVALHAPQDRTSLWEAQRLLFQ